MLSPLTNVVLLFLGQVLAPLPYKPPTNTSFQKPTLSNDQYSKQKGHNAYTKNNIYTKKQREKSKETHGRQHSTENSVMRQTSYR